MSASISDNLLKVANEGSLTTLAAPGKALAASSINITSATGWPTDTGIVFAIRTVDSSGNEVSGTYTEFVGTLSGTTISGLTGTPAYGNDQVYAAGLTTQVYIPVSSYAHNRLITALLIGHGQDGSHNANLSLTTPTLGTPAISNFTSATHTHTSTATGGVIGPQVFANPYKFKVYMTGAANTGNNGFAVIPYDTALFDTGSNVDLVTNKGRFTAPIAGFYHFDAMFEGDVNDLYIIDLFKNGAEYTRGSRSVAGANPDLTVSDTIQLAQGDYVEVAAFALGAARAITRTTAPDSPSFSGFLVSKT